jgi:hypothetical protein
MSNISISLRFAKSLLKRPMKDFLVWIRPAKVSEDRRLRMLQLRLLRDLTYRLPDSAKKDLLIGFKEWKRIVSRRKTQNLSDGNRPCVLVSTSNQKEIAVEYISTNSGFKDIHVLVREELSIDSLPLKFHLFALRISLQCMFDSRRVNLALLIREVVEWTAVIDFISTNNTKEFFDFTPFEKDSNALAFLLMKRKIKVTKIPSSGPLTGHHTFMIANDVVLSSAYQLEELTHFNNWHVSRLLHWPPERYLTYAHHYKNSPIAPCNTIGFYSHGEWVRRKAGHADFGHGIQENEMFLLESLRLFLKANPKYQLLIFPHPKERLDNEFAFFYSNFFAGTNTKIAPIEMKSSENFSLVNIGLMAYSTILFERLALGYKCLIGTSVASSFPLDGSPLHNLCISDYTSLENEIILANKESDKEFFIRCNLEKYHLKEFLKENVAVN